MADQPLLNELSLDLWKKIIILACTDSDHAFQNTLLKALRSRSRTLRAACDECRTNIRINSTQVATGSPHLRKLINLTDVTLFVEDGSTFISDLLLLSNTVPNLTSLTLTPERKGRLLASSDACTVWDISIAMHPLCHRLQHLCLENCTLKNNYTNAVNMGPNDDPHPTSLSPYFQALWAPGLPALKSLIIHNCEFKRLALGICKRLDVLELCDNPSLTSLNLYTSAALRTFVCKDNPNLAVLDVSHCPDLQALECTGNLLLVSLTLPVKQGIQFTF